jgi:lipoprotein-anchoring transpeptidase ErfK/SrfK
MNLLRYTTILMFTSAGAFAETATRRIIISIPDHKLALVDGDRVVKVYGIAVGKRSTPSPAGVFQVVNRLDHPTWHNHGHPVRPGPANPLGTRWLGLSAPGYGIHGTNKPSSIGKSASHGCIRMRNQDVEELFTLVEIGDTVELVTEVTPEMAKYFASPDSNVVAGGGL